MDPLSSVHEDSPRATSAVDAAAAVPPPARPARPRLAGSPAVTGLFVLACLYTLAFAKDVLMPLTLALIIAFLFSPVVEWLSRRRVPKALGAAAVVAFLLGSLVGGIYFLADPARQWMAEAPTVLTQLQQKFGKTVADFEAARQQVEDMMTKPEAPPPAGRRARSASPPPAAAKPASFSLLDLAVLTTTALAQAGWVVIIVISLTYMLLISEDIIKMRLARVLPSVAERKRALAIVEGVKREVASYLGTITVINAGVGVTVGLALFAAGLPNPLLWGALAAVLNYLPYIGPIIGITVIGMVGLLTFADPADALVPVALYLGIHGIESQAITPAILGRRMTLNPALVFIAIALWGWLWGIVGGLIAVPMLAIVKVFCDHIEGLKALGELLSGAERRPRPVEAPPLPPPS